MRHQITCHRASELRAGRAPAELDRRERELADLGAAIAEDGIAAHQAAVNDLVADARLGGIDSAALDVLVDSAHPQILRARAFAAVVADLVGARRATTSVVRAAAQSADAVRSGSTHAVSSPSTRFSRPKAIQEPRHMVSSTSSRSS